MFSRLRQSLLDLLFPRVCVRCGREGTWLCTGCRLKLPTTLCHGNAWSLLSFHEPWVAEAIHALKYSGAADLATLFGTLLAERWPQHLSDDPGKMIVTAIPLHPRRERERGFNQSEQIAKAFCAVTSLPYARLLERRRKTKVQASLDAHERQRNLLGAFRMGMDRKNLDTTAKLVFSLKTVILIDDVVTTGATLHEASSVLHEAGVTTVLPLTVAFAPREHEPGRVGRVA